MLAKYGLGGMSRPSSSRDGILGSSAQVRTFCTDCLSRPSANESGEFA